MGPKGPRLCEKGTFGHRHAQGERHVKPEAEIRVMLQKPRSESKPQKLEGPQMTLPPTSGGASPVDTLTLDLWPPELREIKFLCLGPSVVGTFCCSPRKPAQEGRPERAREKCNRWRRFPAFPVCKHQLRHVEWVFINI